MRVVILSSQSLFSEGVAARLRQFIGAQDVISVDASQPDALEQIIQLLPGTVVLDSTDEDVSRQCPLGTLLSRLPSLKIIRIDPEQSQIQIVSSEQLGAAQIEDLVKVINSG